MWDGDCPVKEADIAREMACALAAGNPLPPVVHATLDTERIGDGRVIVIGDIHGCPGELADLLTK